MEVKYVKHGIANNFGTYIEMNEKLKLYPRLHIRLLKHELGHTDKPGFTKQDFMHDVMDDSIGTWEIMKFMIRHPSAFSQLMPFYKSGKTIVYDINMMIAWGTCLLIVGLAAWLALL